MAKNHHLPVVLSFVVLCFYCSTECSALGHGKEHRRWTFHRVATDKDQRMRLAVQRIYSAQVGVRERTGNNDGPQIEMYLRSVGLPPGEPWCTAFVCWVLEQAGATHPKSGWSPSLFPSSKVVWPPNNRGLATLPQTGDVFGIWFPDKKRVAHVGFVDRWTDAWVITVEGNTNENGSREGDGVYRKRRLVRSIHKVADWISTPNPSLRKGGNK